MAIEVIPMGRGAGRIDGWEDGTTHARITWRGWEDGKPETAQTYSAVYDTQRGAMGSLQAIGLYANLELVSADLEPFTTRVGTPEGTRNPRGELVYAIAEHKTDAGRFCGWSHGDTLRSDRQCPDRCASIAPQPEAGS